MILAIPLVSSPVTMRFSSDAPLSQVIIEIVYGIGFSTLPVIATSFFWSLELPGCAVSSQPFDLHKVRQTCV